MSKRKDRRRRSFFWHLIFTDPLRKLLAIGLALALWLYLDSQVTMQWQRPLTFDAYNQVEIFPPEVLNTLWVPLPLSVKLPNRYLNADTNEVIPSVTLHFEGPKVREEDVMETQQFQVRPRDDIDNPSVHWFVIHKEDIRLPGILKGMLKRMEPPRVKIELHLKTESPMEPPRITEEMLVFLDPDDEARYGGRLQLDKARLDPPVFNGMGTQAFFESSNIRYQVRIPPNPRRRGQRPEVRGRLVLHEDLEKNFPYAEINSVDVIIPIEPKWERFDLWAPVWLDDLALPEGLRGTFEPVDPVLHFTIQVDPDRQLSRRAINNNLTGDKLEEWCQRHLRAVVRITEQDVERDQTEYDLEARIEVVVDFDVEPGDYKSSNTLTVPVRKKPGGGDRGGSP